MAYSITLAGQDITLYTDELSIDIQDSLGQSSGAGSSSLQQGRAGTIQFNTSLGPITSAIGAGSTIIPTAAATDTFAGRTSSSGWGNASDGQQWVGNGSFCTVGSNEGSAFASTGLPQFPDQTLGTRTPVDVEVLFRVSLGGANTAYCFFRNQDAQWLGNAYRVQFGSSAFKLQSVSGFTATDIASVASSPNTSLFYWVRARVVGNVLSAKYWQDGTTEPASWTITGTSSTYSGGGRVGFVFSLNVANAVLIDDFSATNLAMPVLVRQGEIVVKDSTGATVWGGFATKYTDTSTAILGQTKQNFTTINGVDYEAQLSRIVINESFVAQTDVQIITFVLAKYAPWIDRSQLPAVGLYTFPVKNFRNVTVLSVLQTIAGITGFIIWIDFSRVAHYSSPTTTASAPFSLSSSPDFVASFPHNVQEYIIDDNSAINRVVFYGGKKPSGDFTQDVSPLANGNNKVFPTAYYPRVTSDGKYHVTVNGVEQTIGFATGSEIPSNTFVSAGGTAQVLINPDAHNITFDTAPTGGQTVLIRYQYEFPLVISVTDEFSHTFFGDPYLDGSISDQNIFDTPTAIQRCKVLLAQQSFGLVSLKVDHWKPGIKSGQTIMIQNTLRGINGSYLVQAVETAPLGAGNFVYHLTLGAWNWNVIDVIVKLAGQAAVSDQTSAEDPSLLLILQVINRVDVQTSWVKKAETTGPYYARSTPVVDGHDAYPGFATIST